MTGHKLDRLFEAARTVEPQTSPAEVSSWIAAAAGAAAAVGIASKLKLLLTKKMIIMMTGTVSVLGSAVMLSAGLLYNGDNTADQARTVPVVHLLNDKRVDPEVLAIPGTDLRIMPETSAWLKPELDDSVHTPTNLPAAPAAPVIPGTVGASSSNGRAMQAPPDTTGAPLPYSELTVGPFKKLRLDGIYEVVIVQGNEDKVLVGQGRAGEVVANNEGDVLTISYAGSGKNSESLKEDKDNQKGRDKQKDKTKIKEEDGSIVLHITVRELTGLEVMGIGNVTVQDLKTQELDVTFTGVGDVHITTTCDRFSLTSGGVGEVRLAGSAKRAVIDYTGVGDIAAYDLSAEEMTVDCSGIGNLFVYATGSIVIHSSGIGDIRYKGDPDNEEINFSGIGSVSENKGD